MNYKIHAMYKLGHELSHIKVYEVLGSKHHEDHHQVPIKPQEDNLGVRKSSRRIHILLQALTR